MKGYRMSTATPVSPSLLSMDLISINTIRTLSMDAVQAANSGHPRTPMALAPVAAGHASMLLDTLLRLKGVKAVSKDDETLGEPSVPLEAIQRFRQLDNRCPGHPEYCWTSGVETTTGPLG